MCHPYPGSIMVVFIKADPLFSNSIWENRQKDKKQIETKVIVRSFIFRWRNRIDLRMALYYSDMLIPAGTVSPSPCRSSPFFPSIWQEHLEPAAERFPAKRDFPFCCYIRASTFDMSPDQSLEKYVCRRELSFLRHFWAPFYLHNLSVLGRGCQNILMFGPSFLYRSNVLRIGTITFYM